MGSIPMRSLTACGSLPLDGQPEVKGGPIGGYPQSSWPTVFEKVHFDFHLANLPVEFLFLGTDGQVASCDGNSSED